MVRVRILGLGLGLSVVYIFKFVINKAKSEQGRHRPFGRERPFTKGNIAIAPAIPPAKGPCCPTGRGGFEIGR